MNLHFVPEMRMQERVFMGMDRKPFMDIQPSDAAICDRAVSCVVTDRSKELHIQHFKLNSTSSIRYNITIQSSLAVLVLFPPFVL